MRWLICDSLSCPEQFFCSHLDSFVHYLNEAGEDAMGLCLNLDVGQPNIYSEGDSTMRPDVLFLMDQYNRGATAFPDDMRVVKKPVKRIAMVAAICNPMPWDVRKPDGSPAYDCVISSIPWMVEQARAAGCRAEFRPLAFDSRARVCGMGVKRDIDCLFIGTVGANHVRRTKLLHELRDIVTVMPPVYGRAYFKALARARVVLNIHAEWARGAANNMRLYEAAGMGCQLVSDGTPADAGSNVWWYPPADDTAEEWRYSVELALKDDWSLDPGLVLDSDTYESRIPYLIDIARSL